MSGAPDALVDFHTGMHCRAERESDGSYDPHCGANDADRNCDDWTIYTVESALNLAHLPPCAPCPARNSECPALEPLKPEECLPGNPAADDCVGHDCVYGYKLACVEINVASMAWRTTRRFSTNAS